MRGKIKPKKVLIILVLLAILIYIGYIIYRLLVNPTDTFTVEEGKLYYEEATTGYIIREEKVVQGKNYKNGIVQIKTEGEKVSKGESIFRYYSNGEDELVKKIPELDEKIQEALEKEQSTVFSSDIKTLENQIDNKIEELSQTNNVQKIEEYAKDIKSIVTKKAKIAGELSPSGSYTKKLIEERSTYENKLNSGAEYIDSPMSGIVSYRVDGLEDVLTAEDFTKLSKATLDNLNLKTGQLIASSNESGKVINNFKCYIAVVMNTEKAKEAEENDVVQIRLSNAEEIPATIKYKNQEDEENVLLVFEIEKCVEELINYRKISIDVIWWSYSGLKVPNTAIIEENGLNYVIRKRAGYEDKLLVKVLRKNESYSIVSNYNTEELKELGLETDEINTSKKITLYDEILNNPKKIDQ